MQAGWVVTCEPGIYIRDGALDRLPDTAENRTFKDKVRPLVQRYLNIGVRLEDSFLLTDAGPERLSGSVPYTIEDIERVLQTKRPVQ